MIGSREGEFGLGLGLVNTTRLGGLLSHVALLTRFLIR